jgi:hypothetical protein
MVTTRAADWHTMGSLARCLYAAFRRQHSRQVASLCTWFVMQACCEETELDYYS